MNRREVRSPQNLLLKKRMEIIFIALMLAFVALALRLVWIQGIKQEHFRKLADKMRRRTIPAPSRRGVIPDTEREIVPPVEGHNITLTIDARIQEFAEAELAKVASTYHPEGATAVAMDVRSGDVLAMANWPTYDPNTRGSVPPANRRNR